MTPDMKEMLDEIRAFVAQKRKEYGIKGYPGPQLEGSCIAFGEFHNLLYRNLMYARPDEWYALSDPEILEGVYREVLYDSGKMTFSADEVKTLGEIPMLAKKP